MSLLRILKLSKIYRPDSHVIHALQNIDLEIKKGAFLAIVGPSGSGKSTLMHLIGCLDTPTSGQIILEGKNISRLSESQLARIRNQKIGFIFQSFNLIPRLTALENVELPLIYGGAEKSRRLKKAASLLIDLGLKDRLSHYPNQLSGGQQQRVAIARALVTQPSIILADEPTGNVDSKTGQEIMKIFKDLNRKGNTIIIVTHDQEIAKTTDRIISIRDGMIN